MQQAIPETFSREEWVTPDLARTYLEANTRNRNLRKPYVAHLASLIASGEFFPCVGSISFDVDGRLIDGQHRLSAIVMADAPVKLIVVRNAPTEAQAVIDTGNRRQNADWLTMRKIKYAKLAAAAIKMILDYRDNPEMDFQNDLKKSRSALEIERFYNDNSSIAESVECGIKLRHIIFESTAAFTHYTLGVIDPTSRDYFFSKLEMPEHISADSPIMVLRTSLERFRHEQRNSYHRHRHHIEISRIFHAWNLFRTGKTAKRLNMPAEFPKPV
jgi:hypothetical protein